jgi:hypothetical protein
MRVTSLTVGADLAHENIVGVGLVDASLGQSGSVEEHVLPVGPEHKAEALTAVVPLDLGLDQAGVAALRRIIVRHVSLQSTLVFSAERDAGRVIQHGTPHGIMHAKTSSEAGG